MSAGPVLVLDLGGRYAQLIARRVRGGVYSRLVGHEVSASDVGQAQAAALILSGGLRPCTPRTRRSSTRACSRLGVPTLGIC